MRLVLNINNEEQEVSIQAGDLLLKTLRRLGFFGVKHGCETGECGACAVLLDGKPVNSCVLLAAQADGHTHPDDRGAGRAPRAGLEERPPGLHPLQQAFVESGAIQCGYCTPAQILAAKELLERNPNPSEAEVREALSGVLCRCTGYLEAGAGRAARRGGAARRERRAAGRRCSRPFRSAEQWLPPGEGEQPASPLPDFAKPLSIATRVMPRITVAPADRRPGSTWASQSRRWMPSSWCRASRPSPPISRCAACWSPKCCTARIAHARIKQHRCQPGARACPAWLPC